MIAKSSKISYNDSENKDKNSQICVKLPFIILSILWKKISVLRRIEYNYKTKKV